MHTGDTAVARVPSSTAGAPDIYVHFATVFAGSGRGDGTVGDVNGGETRNLSVPSATAGTDTNRDPGITSLGGIANERGLRLQQISPQGNANRQDLTVTFRSGVSPTSTVVTTIQALSFYIVDIDSLTTPAYSDRVILTSSAPYGQTRDAGVTGTGASGTPWLATNTNANISENQVGARVLVNFDDSYVARMSSFTLSYWTNTGATAPATGQYHRIYLGDFSFKTCP